LLPGKQVALSERSVHPVRYPRHFLMRYSDGYGIAVRIEMSKRKINLDQRRGD